MTKGNPFPALLRAFFQEWLAEQRSASVHTIRSYRDTWRLLLRFIAERKGAGVARIMLADVSASEVRAFLHHTEHERRGTIGTRNCRLAAIRSFFSFVADKDPEYIAQCAEVLTVPLKREPTAAPCYLEPEEVEAILAQPDRSTIEGMRDHVLLSFLYNSGARIQEALDLCSNAVRFDAPHYARLYGKGRKERVAEACALDLEGVDLAGARIRLYGKGRKERICPLWPETVTLLRKLLERHPRAPDQRIFVNRYGEPLGASGVRFKLAAYVEKASKTVPTLRSKHVTPHSFRHATAVHLVAAGVDITVIRSWLGHVSLDTTNHYAQANLETKRKALEQVGAPAASNVPPSWKREASLMEWLDAL